MNISVTILTYNSEKTVEKTLLSLKGFSDILVLDSGSIDATKELCQKFPSVRFVTSPFLGFGPMHNRATSLAKHDWILSLDSDEEMTQPLYEEIGALSMNPSVVYSISRKNRYRGKHIQGCGWWPDRVIRLYNRTKTSFSEALVHESVLADGMTVVELQQSLLHTPCLSVAHFIRKIETYSNLYAQQYTGQKKISSCTPYLHALFAFLKSYILKRGFLDGWEGLEISCYNANCALYKYLLLKEKNESKTIQEEEKR